MKAAILAMSAAWALGMAACNREAKDGSGGRAADTASAAGKIGEQARETGREIAAATGKAVEKTEEETRQAARDVKEGAGKLADKAGKGAKRTGDSAQAKAGGLMPGDEAETESDRQLVARIRGQLAADKETASEARDIRIDADSGKVELEGTVTSRDAKTKIVRVVNRLAGPKNVKDELKVAERVGTGNTER